MQFKNEEKCIVPNSKSAREPKLFNFFPEAKTDIENFCSKEVNLGSLSSESLRNEIKNTILPNCYNQLLEDTKDDASSMPSYDEMIYMLDLKTISLSTVWRWLLIMGFSYDKNKRFYYTDGHEREDVVAGRNNRFLVAYFKSEKKSISLGPNLRRKCLINRN